MIIRAFFLLAVALMQFGSTAYAAQLINDGRLQGTTTVPSGATMTFLSGASLNISSATLTLPARLDIPSLASQSGKILSNNGSVLSWTSAGAGDLVGPSSATDNGLPRFDGTTGKLLQTSALTLSDTGLLKGAILSDGPVTTDADFAIVVIPDSQTLTADNTSDDVLVAQLQWAADNKVAENVKAVISVGDITGDAQTAQFDRAVTAYNIAKTAGIIVMPVVGNHDYASSAPSSRDTTTFDSKFGTAYHSGQAGLGGTTYPTGSHANYYYTFTNGGTTFLILAVEFHPRAAAISWAQGIIAANPTAYIIITTHSHLKNTGTRVLDADSYGPNAYSLGSDYNGDDLYNALAKPYSNVRMIVSGHFIDGAKTASASEISATTGAVTHQLFVNYQDSAVAAHYMMILRFKPTTGVISVSYYSPTLAAVDSANPGFDLPYIPLKVDNSIAADHDGFIGRDLTVKRKLTVGSGELPNFVRIDERGNILAGTDDYTSISGTGNIKTAGVLVTGGAATIGGPLTVSSSLASSIAGSLTFGSNGNAAVTRSSMNGQGIHTVFSVKSDAKSASDALQLEFSAQDSASAAQNYSLLRTTITDPTAGSEDAELEVRVAAAGSVGLSATFTAAGVAVDGTLSATGALSASNFSGTSSGTNTGDQTSVSGNAGTATALQTARTIGGSSFDGTANVTSFPSPGAIGGTTPSTGAFTTLSASGQITSTVATGSAPFVVSSTTNVANLNASTLNGATFAAPGAIGGTTPAAGTFTALTTTSGVLTVGGTGVSNIAGTLTFGSNGSSAVTRGSVDGLGLATVFSINSNAKTAADAIQMEFGGRDSADNAQAYGAIRTNIVDPTSTSEDGSVEIRAATNGSMGLSATFTSAGVDVDGNLTTTGTIAAGSGPTTLTDASGKILSAALNTVAVGQGGTGATTLTGILKGNGTSAFTAAARSDYDAAQIVGTFASPTTTNPYSLAAADAYGTILHYGATGEIDLPAGAAGMNVVIYNTGAFTITIDPNGTEIIVRDGTAQSGGVSITLSSGAGNYVAMYFDGSRWITLGYKGTLAQGS